MRHRLCSGSAQSLVEKRDLEAEQMRLQRLEWAKLLRLFSNARLRSFHSFLSDVGDCLKFLKQGITMTRNRL